MFEDYQFEWDPQKDEANLKKHSLSFERARTICCLLYTSRPFG